MSDRGEEVHGEITSADLTTAGAFTLFDMNGDVRPLLATERLVVTDIVLIIAVASTVTAFFDKGDDGGAAGVGEKIVSGGIGTQGGVAFNFFRTPRYGPINAPAKIIASLAGQIDGVLTGYILKV